MSTDTQPSWGESLDSLLVDSVPDAILVVDEHGTIRRANRQAETLFGYSASELLGAKIERLVPEATAGVHEGLRNRYMHNPCFRAMGMTDKLLMAKHQDGHNFPVEVSLTPLLQSEGVAVVAVIRETFERLENQTLREALQERQSLERKLWDQHSQLCQMIDALPVLIAFVGNDQRYRIVNAAYEHWYGQSCEEILGKTLIEVLGDSIYASLSPYIDEVLAGKTVSFDTQRSDAQGRPQTVRSTYVPHWDRNSQLDGFFAHVADVTEHREMLEALRTAKDQAESANRMKSEFLANMSHEIRTPMNAIIGFADILSTKLDPQDPLYRYVTGIHTSGRSLLQLLNDVLDISRLEAQRVQIEPQPVDLHALVEEMKHIFVAEFENRGLRFWTALPEHLPRRVMLDQARLRQVLLNLLGNALKFTRQGSVGLNVAMRGEVQQGWASLIISVEDTGIGIPASQQTRIFEAFRQRDGQDQSYGGTGLGLSICRELVDLMHGRLSLNSAPGKGSCFRVWLDVEVMPDEVETVPTISPRVLRFQQADILLVDDVPVNREVVRGMLQDHALTLREASNGVEALALCEQQPPDLILLDLRMPVMDGYGFARRARQDPRLRELPIIIMSAFEEALEEDGPAPLWDAFLRKPVTQQQLLGVLRRFLAHEGTAPVLSQEAQPPPSPELALPTTLPVALLTRFDAEILPAYQALSGQRSLSHIRELASNMSELGTVYSVTALADYGKQLLQAARQMKIGEINRLLERFPEIQQALHKARS